MKRTTFLGLASVIALFVGAFALTFPALLLESKGVVPTGAVNLWMRETGALLLSIGCIGWLVRKHADSPTMRALMLGNLLIQLGLFVLEVLGYVNGVITQLSGIVPNISLHIVLSIGFAYFWLRRG